MIILDTNVLSEAMRATFDPAVKAWMEAQPRTRLFVTAISEAEIYYGLAALPVGKRRTQLAEAADAVFREFDGRVLPFDRAAARAFGDICAARRKAGRPIGDLDAQIAAIARARDATVATRNVADFNGCGIDVVSPWDGAV